MAYRIPVTREEVTKAKGMYTAGYSVQDIAKELDRTGKTVRNMIHGLYDNLEPKKPKEKEKEKPLWKVVFEIEWENAVNRIRKAMGKEPL